MKRILFTIVLILSTYTLSKAQDYNQITDDGTFTAPGYQRNRNFGRSDSVQQEHKEIPRGLKMWTVDTRFGDRTDAQPDTMQYMYMNSIFTTGLHGEYNTLGNLGSARENRIFIDRNLRSQFTFLDVYDFFIVKPENFKFTNTLSPITNVSLNSAGNRTNGEDHFKALFAVNAGKRLGLGFKFDYLYGRGYYSNQSTSHLNYSLWASYLGERYQVHFLAQLNHQKVAENGGITNDAYITHPEQFNENFSTDELPTVLSENWNRNDNQHIFFNHRYNIGFYKQEPMTAEEIEARKFAIRSQKQQEQEKAREKARRRAKENNMDFDEEEFDRTQQVAGRPDDARIAGDEPAEYPTNTSATRKSGTAKDALAATEENTDTIEDWTKRVYVPVTSFIHTLDFNNYRRIYQAYESPENYYDSTYYNAQKFQGDSIYDKTKHWSMRNTVALALLEGFNKWAKAGLKIFASYELRHFELPTLSGGIDKWNQHNVSVGGQLLKTQGSMVHYNATAETWLTGDDAGQLKIDGNADLNFPLFGDTVQLAAHGHFYRLQPTFYMEHYHAKHYWWDNDGLDKELYTRLGGTFRLKKLGTKFRIDYDNIKNYTYLASWMNYDSKKELYTDNKINVKQNKDAVSILTLQLQQNLEFFKFIHWESIITYQKSSNEDVLPLPDLNIYTNLYVKFKLAKVLKCDLGADMRYFTNYYANEYSPQLGQFVVQENEAVRVKTGNYPLINVYANFHLKHTRFFVMFSHVNSSSGNHRYLFTPHYPLNQLIFRFGLSWNFFN